MKLARIAQMRFEFCLCGLEGPVAKSWRAPVTNYIVIAKSTGLYRSADSRFDRLPAMAADLVSDPVAAIVALGPPATVAAKAATTTIPIVFAMGADPVDLGLVSKLNRPGGNVTGVTFLTNTLGAKRLELLHELIPSVTVVGFLINPGNPTSEFQIRDVQAAARVFDIEPLILHAGSERNIAASSILPIFGFSRHRGIDQIRRADFLGKRACPNDLPACGRPASKHEKNRPVVGSRGAQQRTSPLMRQSGGYTEECCTVERKREGSLRREKRYAQLRNARSFCLRSVSQRSLLRLVFI